MVKRTKTAPAPQPAPRKAARKQTAKSAKPAGETFDPRVWMVDNHPLTASWLGYDLVKESMESPRRRGSRLAT